MYTDFFGLNEKPFSITPDPRYLFMSERHGEALAHLVYGVTESGGFMQLTGEVGTGKTTIVRTLLLNRMPANADVAVILNPQLSALEFLATICEELHVAVPKKKHGIKALIDALNGHLLKAHADGRRTILVVDEAQNLAPEVLEQVRLLTNLETAKQKLLQIILIGQPELRELLARNDLRQLAQRITGRYHLEPLSRDESARYIEHRLKVAGAIGEIFGADAKRQVYKSSEGVPRLINVICDRALLGAYSIESRHVDIRLVRQAAAEVSGEDDNATWSRWTVPAIGVAVAVVIVAGYLSILNQQRGNTAIDTQDAAVVTILSAPQSNEPNETLDQQLQLAAELTNADAGLATLFNLWGLDDSGSSPADCNQAEAAGYRCMYQRGSWSGLKQFNRPAMLTLIDSRGDEHFVVLVSVGENTVELSIGGVNVTHPSDVVSDMWFGQYLLLWHPPNGIVATLGPGSRGTNVAWLRQSLAAIGEGYRTDAIDSDEFDDDLRRKVRLFQRDYRIDVDGVAGQQTQIIINTLVEPGNTPRLAQE